MTDNEIINALECCSHRGKGCDDCPVNYKTAEFCFEDVMSDALDLINSQKAEIEKIKIDLKYYLDNNEENGVVYIPKFVIDDLVKEMTVVQESEEN